MHSTHDLIGVVDGLSLGIADLHIVDGCLRGSDERQEDGDWVELHLFRELQV